jgi:hypothetical protein
MNYPFLEDMTYIINLGFRYKLRILYSGILKRTDGKFAAKTRGESYVGCTTTFKDQEDFSEWAVKQKGFGLEAYELDKDIVMPGNKVYCKDYCVFVPVEVNIFFIRTKNKANGLPQGVYKKTGEKRCYANLGGLGKKNINLGYFDSVEEAFNAYCNEKNKIAKIMAEIYKDSVDNRVYEALVNFNAQEYYTN